VHLSALDGSDHELTSLPPEIGNLTELQMLFVANNSLGDVPPEIGNLTRITRISELWLTDNPLNTLPPQLCAVFSEVVFPQSLCTP